MGHAVSGRNLGDRQWLDPKTKEVNKMEGSNPMIFIHLLQGLEKLSPSPLGLLTNVFSINFSWLDPPPNIQFFTPEEHRLYREQQRHLGSTMKRDEYCANRNNFLMKKIQDFWQKETVKKNKRGIMFTGGFEGISRASLPGHSMWYVVEKQDSSHTFSFTVFNLGGGSDLAHPSKTILGSHLDNKIKNSSKITKTSTNSYAGRFFSRLFSKKKKVLPWLRWENLSYVEIFENDSLWTDLCAIHNMASTYDKERANLFTTEQPESDKRIAGDNKYLEFIGDQFYDEYFIKTLKNEGGSKMLTERILRAIYQTLVLKLVPRLNSPEEIEKKFITSPRQEQFRKSWPWAIEVAPP